MSQDSTSRRRRFLGGWFFSLLLIVPAFFVYRYFDDYARETGTELEATRTKLNELQEAVAAYERESEQLRLNQKIIRDFLRECRDATDIPKLPGGRIYSAARNIYSPLHLNFFVPPGQHTLTVKAILTGGSPETVDSKEWEKIPLIGDSGYLLTLDRQLRDKSEPISWKLGSNNSEFEPRAEELPIEGFIARSWGGVNTGTVAVFPNQIRRGKKRTRDLTLLKYSISGLREEQSYHVSFEVSLTSEGDEVVGATQASGPITYHDLDGKLKPYEGGGYFVVEEN